MHNGEIVVVSVQPYLLKAKLSKWRKMYINYPNTEIDNGDGMEHEWLPISTCFSFGEIEHPRAFSVAGAFHQMKRLVDV